MITETVAFTLPLIALSLLLRAAWLDVAIGLLPDRLTLSAAVLVLIAETLHGRAASALLGALVGFGLLKSAQLLYRRVRGHDGLGSGDAKLMLALGAIGPWGAVATIGLGSALALLYAVPLFLMRPPDSRPMTSPFPFGPALIAAGLTAKIYLEYCG